MTKHPASSLLPLSCLAATLFAAAPTAQDRLFDLVPGQVPWGGAPTLRSVGDVDGDGVNDYTVHNLSSIISLALISGRTGTTITQISPGNEFPLILVDLDGDGILEFISTTAVYSNGEFHVREAGPNGPVRYTLPAFFGPRAIGEIRVLDDVNGDGVMDLAAGDPFAEGTVNGQTIQGVGRVLLYSGADGTLLHELRPEGSGLYFGTLVTGIADVDGDGLGELAITADDRVLLYGGTSGQLLRELGTADPQSMFGSAVADIGDITGDGFPEIAIGAPQQSLTTPAGYVALIDSTTGAEVYRMTGTVGDRFGGALATIDDMDGDGMRDLLVGAPQSVNQWNFTGPGRVEVRSSADGALLLSVEGNEDGDSMGWSVLGLGDINGDGVADFAASIGGPNEARSTANARVISGAPLLLCGDRHLGSAAAGTTQSLDVDGGATRAGQPYLILGSVSGVAPGFDVAGHHIPLNVDGWLLFTATSPGSVLMPGSIGFLDQNGEASASLILPAIPALQGLAFDHAALVFDGTAIDAVSSAIPLTLQP